MNLEKKIGYLNSSRKNTQFQKTNQLKRSSGSKVMSILNSAVFQSFSGKKPQFFAITYCSIFGGFFIARCILQGNVMALVLNHSLKK
jgi:hypothetical protein